MPLLVAATAAEAASGQWKLCEFCEPCVSGRELVELRVPVAVSSGALTQGSSLGWISQGALSLCCVRVLAAQEQAQECLLTVPPPAVLRQGLQL